MSHFVLCPYCKQKFDRDKEEYALIGARRYAHAACMLREAERDPNYVKKEIIDPLDNVKCSYCQKPMSKKDADCVMFTKLVKNLKKSVKKLIRNSQKIILKNYLI